MRAALDDLADWGEGLIAMLAPDDAGDLAALRLRQLAGLFPGRCYIALTPRRPPRAFLRLHDLINTAAQAGVPTAGCFRMS